MDIGVKEHVTARNARAPNTVSMLIAQPDCPGSDRSERDSRRKDTAKCGKKSVCGRNEDNRWRSTTKTLSSSCAHTRARAHKKTISVHEKLAIRYLYIGTCARAIPPLKETQKMGAFCLLATDSLAFCARQPRRYAQCTCTRAHTHTYRCGSV